MPIGVTGDFVPLGSFKVIDGKNVGGALTGSAVSSSGLLFASTTYDSDGAFSNVVVADTASGRFYVTSSYGAGGSTGDAFPFTGSAAISGSLAVEGNTGAITAVSLSADYISASVNLIAPQITSLTSSMVHVTASLTSLTSSVVALTASQVLQDSQITALTSSMVHVTASLTSLTSSVVALTASAVLQGSQILASTGSGTIVITNITNSGTVANTVLTGSFTGSFTGDGSNLTGVEIFPFTGSAAISGSLSVEGNTGAITASGDISASGTGSFGMITSDKLVSHTGDVNTGLQFASDTVIIEGGDEIIGRFSTTNIQLGVREFVGGFKGTQITGSLHVSGSTSGITSSGDISASSGTITALNYQNTGTVANTDLTGSFTGSFTGPLTGTSSHAETASFATTASHALNTGQTSAAGSDQEIQYNDGGSFGGNAGLKFDDSLDASLFVAGPITASLISSSGFISASSLNIKGGANAINVSSGTNNVAINATSTDADVMIVVSDNGTGVNNNISFGATGDDLHLRNDEGNLKVKVNNNQKVALELSQAGDLSLTGSITGLNFVNTGTVANTKLTGSFTGSFTGNYTGPQITSLTSSVVALTASQVLQDSQITSLTSSMVHVTASLTSLTSSVVALTASAVLQGSQILASTGSGTIIITNITNTGTVANSNLTGSFTGSFTGNGSGLSGITAAGFPFTGSAAISGSLVVNGPDSRLASRTASFGTGLASTTTNPAGTPLFVLGNISASGDLKGDELVIHSITDANPASTQFSINTNGLATFDSLQIGGTVNLNGSSNNYGNGAGDKHTFTGNITASNDITASGDVFANEFVLQNEAVLSGAGTTFTIGGSSKKSSYRGLSHLFSTAITASTHISSSGGTITGLNYLNTGTVANTKLTGSFTGSFTGDGSSLTGVAGFPFTGSAAISGSLSVNGPVGHITSSGNISASGDLIVSDITLDGDITHTGDADTKISLTNDQISLYAGSATLTLNVSSTTVRPGANQTVSLGATSKEWKEVVTQHITASGGITASAIDVVSNRLRKTSATDADHQGDVVFFGSTVSMDADKIYHYTSGGVWVLSNATDNTKSTGLLAVALGAVSNTNGMLLKGMVTLDHDPGAVGDELFLRTSDGLAINSAPGGSGNVTRIIGYCLDASNGQIYFNPSNDFIVHA